MNFKEFIKNEGLKKLALTKLKPASFSLLIYLFNEILSGVQEIISSKKELSLLLGWTEKQINEGLNELQFYNMVQIIELNGKPLRIKAQLNIEQWKSSYHTHGDIKKPSLGNASNLHSIVPTENSSQKNNFRLVDLNIFDEPIPFPKNQKRNDVDLSEEQEDFYPFENSLNDLGAYREKNEIIDTKIRILAQEEINKIKNTKKSITSDEELLLQILIQHHQPRKQLFWALRSNFIYPNLTHFLNKARVFVDLQDINKK